MDKSLRYVGPWSHQSNETLVHRDARRMCARPTPAAEAWFKELDFFWNHLSLALLLQGRQRCSLCLTGTDSPDFSL